MDQAANEFQTLYEVVAAAHRALNRSMWDYLVGGTGTETMLRRNRLALDRVGFRPRVLEDVLRIDNTWADWMDHRLRLPVALAPWAGWTAWGRTAA